MGCPCKQKHRKHRCLFCRPFLHFHNFRFRGELIPWDVQWLILLFLEQRDGGVSEDDRIKEG